MVSAHLPLESGLSNASSTTDTSLDQVVFVLQRFVTILSALELPQQLLLSLVFAPGLPRHDRERSNDKVDLASVRNSADNVPRTSFAGTCSGVYE